MANVQKFTSSNMKGLSIHLDRKTKNHSNKEIDIEKTHLNYDLCEKDGDTLSRMNERLKDVYCMKRENVKVGCSWVVTLPENLKEIGENEQRKFFEKTYEFLTDRYGGEKNVLSAQVHNDETTPHLHFAFMPVVWDEKKQREKVSAKEVLNRNELKAFHQDLDRFLKGEIPEIYQEGILNGETIDVENVRELKKFGDEIRAEKEKMLSEIRTFKEPKKVLEKIQKNAEHKKTGVINKKDVVVLDKKDYERLEVLAKSEIKTKDKLDKVNSKIEGLETSVQLADQRVTKSEKRANELEKQLEGKTEKLDKVQRKEIVYKSMLQDTDRDLNISELEEKGRLIMFNLENGHNPKNVEEGSQWLSILEENRKAKTIPVNRLEDFLERLRAFLDKTLGKVSQFSLEGLKNKDNEIKRNAKSQKRKSWDMER